jgi:hypothetical protein
VITLGRGSRVALAIALVVGGALALVVGTTLLIALLGVAVVGGAIGALAFGLRRLVRGGVAPAREPPRLDPALEVFPEPQRGDASLPPTAGESEDER